MKYFRITFDMEAAEIARQPPGMEVLEARTQRTLPLMLDDDPVDYQPNFLFWRLCSPRLRHILDAGKSPADALEWVPVELTAKRKRLVYFRLVSTPLTDVLHPSTLRAGKVLVKPVFDIDRVEPHSVFVIYEEDNIVVTEAVRRKIEAARCTGLVFMNVLMAPRN